MNKPILGIVGWSGSGKTSLLEFLLPRLRAEGLRVHVVKHSHHDISLESEHKDSARLRRAGAGEVLLVSPFRMALMQEFAESRPEPPLSELLPRLSPADLVLVEGYKSEPIPKLEVHRAVLGKTALYPDDEHIIALASDLPFSVASRANLICLDLQQPETVLRWLREDFLAMQ